MVDKILKYLFESEKNTEKMCIYVNAHIKRCTTYQVAQVIIDLHSDNERLTKIIEYFQIF